MTGRELIAELEAQGKFALDRDVMLMDERGVMWSPDEIVPTVDERPDPIHAGRKLQVPVLLLGSWE